MKKRPEAMQTLRAGCSKADPQTKKQTNKQGRSIIYNTLRSLARSVITRRLQQLNSSYFLMKLKCPKKHVSSDRSYKR